MKKNRGKLIIIIASVLLSLYFLYPTYKDYQFNKELKSLKGEDSLKYLEENEVKMRETRSKRIKLGLDLQGGMRVVLEVNTLKMLEDIAKNKDDLFNSLLAEVRAEANRSDREVLDILREKFQAKEVRLSRYYGNIRDSDDDIITRLQRETNNAVDRAMEVVRNRVDQYGVSEPSIQKSGGRRIIVELPGVSKEAEVRQLLQGTALLEFKLLIDPEIAAKVYESIDRTLAGKPIIDTTETDTTAKLASKADTTKKEEKKTETTDDFDIASQDDIDALFK